MTDKEQKSAEVPQETAAFGQKSTEVQALSAAPAVPNEPTNEMYRAAQKIELPYDDDNGTFILNTSQVRAIWQAMLAASPTPPAEQQARWVECWHGSGGKEFWEGWSILNAANRGMIAHLGPDVDPDAVRGIVAAHNEALCGECAGTGGRWCPACAGATPPAEQQAAPKAAPGEPRPVTPYTCPKCHALWLHWPSEQTGLDMDTLNCRSADHCHHCEKGGVEQLQRLERVPAVLTAPQPAPAPLIARSLAEWHEDDGCVAWWAWNGREWAGEPAWIGNPNCEDWPGYHTHWTPHPDQPVFSALAAQERQP